MADKRQWIEALSQSSEDKILFARVYDRIHGGIQKSMPASTCFLSPRESALVGRMLEHDGHCFWGGFEGAERSVCCHIPDYFEAMDWLLSEDGPLCALRATFYAKDILSHRDILGSLMGAGIKRETIGDIFVSEGQCDLIVTREIAPYLLQDWQSAGRTKFRLTQISLDVLEIPTPKVKDVHGTVATLRLDGVLAEGFSMSRGKASLLITGGKVAINGLPCEKTDKQLVEGDKIAARGMGKIILLSVGNLTKKGRIGITIRKFE